MPDAPELELVPLAVATLQLATPIVLPNTPRGMRIVVELESARIEGERLKASLKGKAAADWMVMSAEGASALDVRFLVETDDGALVLVQYGGRINNGVIYSTPTFETGDERYTWLNGIQAVGRGKTEGQTLTYHLYELR